MAEYKLSYTASQINDRLGKVATLSEDVGSLQENVQVISDDVQVKAEIVTLSTEEYEALEANESTNANTLYMLTDAEDDTSVLYTEQTLTDEQKAQARENIGAVNSWNELEDKPSLFSGNYNDLTNLPIYDTTPTSGSTNAVTSGGVFSRFAEQEGYIDEANLVATLALPGSLKWDGVIGERESIVIGQGDPYNMCFVHVSDEYPEILTQLADGDTIPMTAAIMMPDGSSGSLVEGTMIGGVVLAGDANIVIVPIDGYSLEGITFPKKGVYFMAYHMAPMGIDGSYLYVSAFSIMGHSFTDNGASKYFEKKIVNISSGDTLTWDGDITGREYVTQEVTEELVVYFCRISDSVLTEKDVVNGVTYTYTNLQTGLPETKTITAAEAQACFKEDGSFECSGLICVPVDNQIVDGVSLPKAGIYFSGIGNGDGSVILFTPSFTIPGYNFETSIPSEIIKTEHLPLALRFGEIETTIESDTLTWDGNTEGLENLDELLFRVSDVTPTLNDIHQGFSLTFNYKDEDGSGSETVSISAEEAASITMLESGTIPFEYVFVLTLPITYTMEDGTMITYPAGVYFMKDSHGYISSFTINNYKGFTTTNTELVKIDKKYLPDDIGGGSGSGLPEVSVEDEGKTVKVINGEWSVKQMSYNDLSDKPTLGTLASKNTVSKTDLTSDVQTSLGKADTALQSYTETDPTVPSWAKAATKPTYTKSEVGLGNVDNVKQYSASNPPPYPVTKVNNKTGNVTLSASDVGADASGTAASAVSSHNTNTSAHNDIRDLISGLTTRLNALADSDDTTLDQMSEIVAYIKSNKTLIEEVTTNKVNISDIINNLTTNVSTKPLSAAQGVALKALIDSLQTEVNGLQTELDGKVSEDGLFETVTSDTITWDGNAEGRDSVDDGAALVKVGDISDETIADMIEKYQNDGTLSHTLVGNMGNAYSDCNIRPMEDGEAKMVVIDIERYAVYLINSAAFITLGFPSSGIYMSKIVIDSVYYVSSLTIEGFDISIKKVVKSDLLQVDLSSINTTTDTEMSDTSENPVQNKVIKAYIDNEISTFTKADIGLGSVENKSSATIRSEITKDNVTTALGYTPLAPGAQHISNKSSGTYYYKLGTMVADNSGNYGNITISGRLGGWEQVNSANFDIMMLNRSSARDGNTITATVSASGEVEQALTKCDIVVYKQSDTSAIVYLKLNGYWLYDFDWNVYQHSINYSATNVTPTGSLVWSLSTAPKTILDASGNFYMNGSKAATIADIEAAIGAAIAASY